MEKIKTFGSLFLVMLCCFVLGSYASAKEVTDPFKIFLTISIGAFFLVNFLFEYRK